MQNIASDKTVFESLTTVKKILGINLCFSRNSIFQRSCSEKKIFYTA